MTPLQLRSRLGATVFERVAVPRDRSVANPSNSTPGPRRSAKCTGTRRCSPAVSALCCCSPCTRWPWPDSPPTPVIGVLLWGVLQRASSSLPYPLSIPSRTVARIRAIHAGVAGTAQNGRAFVASDPHLLRWAHIAEIDSLCAHQRYGDQPLDQADRGGHVADTARIAGELVCRIHRRPRPNSLARSSSIAPSLPAQPRRDMSCSTRHCPLAVVPHALLAGSAVALLLRWARRPLMLPYLPVTEVTLLRPVGHTVTSGTRWVMSDIPLRGCVVVRARVIVGQGGRRSPTGHACVHCCRQ